MKFQRLIRRIVLIICALFYVFHAESQEKKSVTLETPEYWEKIIEIERDKLFLVNKAGNFIAYKKHCSNGADSICILNTREDRTDKLLNPITFRLLRNSDVCYALYKNDSLVRFDLSSKLVSTRNGAKNVEFISSENDDWIIYNTKSDSTVIEGGAKLVTTNLKKVLRYYFFPSVGQLGIVFSDSLKILDLKTNKQKGIIRLTADHRLFFDGKSGLIAAINGKDPKEIYWYNVVTSHLEKVAYTKTGIEWPENINISECKFSWSGNHLLIQYEEIKNNNEGSINYELWRSDRATISSLAPVVPTTLVCIDLRNGGWFTIPKFNKNILDFTVNGSSQDVAIMVDKVNFEEYYWNSDVFTLSVLNLDTKVEKIIKRFPKSLNYPSISISPMAKSLIYFDAAKQQYTSFDINSDKSKDILLDTKSSLLRSGNGIEIRKVPYGVCGWRAGDSLAWLYDEYDIWEVNVVTGKSICVTKELGNKLNMIFRKCGRNNDFENGIVISGFDPKSKKNGLFEFSDSGGFRFDAQQIGDYLYYKNESTNSLGRKVLNYPPQRSSNGSEYFVVRMSSKVAPNIYMTRDFKEYVPLTNVHPEVNYRVSSAELVSWKFDSARTLSGLLYKPTEFDSCQKYPVIFHFYENKSDELNLFLEPALSYGNLNVLWYTSRGYVIFCPDIAYRPGDNSNSIARSFSSAINAISQFPWVDTSKMGIQGHSFGGYETLVAISKLRNFKVAQESAGTSDLISGFSFVVANNTRQAFYEYNQPNLGCPPWKCPNVYFENSPLFKVSDINTPLLILHNREDEVVSFNQAVELFGALRRNNKLSWLLQYSNEGHDLKKHINKLDFTIKQQQFFDYFLKNTVRPDWLE